MLPKSDLAGLLGKLGNAYDFSQVTVEQIEEIVANSTSKIAVSAFAATLVSSLFQGTPLAVFATLWALSLVSSVGLSLWWVKRRLKAKIENSNPSGTARLVTWLAAMRGLIWGIGFSTLVPAATGSTSILLNWTIAGLIFANAFSYWALPFAALAFSNAVMAAGLFGLLRHFGDNYLATSGIIVGLFAINSIMYSGATKLRRHTELEAKLREEWEKVNLLLDGFAAGTKDWLWRCDANGTLKKGIKGFSEVLQLSADQLEHEPLLAILSKQPMSDVQKECLSEFELALSSKKAFSRQELRLGKATDEQFISLSAIPKFGPGNELLGWHGVASDTTIDRLAEERTRWLAMFDSLTGLPNRVHLRDKLSHLIKRDSNTPAWIIYGDIDGFKQINDTYGHAAGDNALKQLAGRYRSCVGAGEMVARIGGDEFVFLIQREHSGVYKLCKDVIAASCLPLEFDGRTKSVGISLGVAPIADQSSSADELMHRVDVALYYAKKKGRGTAVHYSPELEAHARSRHVLELSLQNALAQREFTLHYQPILQCRDEQVVGVEALIRWNNSSFGDVQPADFILAAEECGFVSEIGAWVLKQACLDLKRLPSHIHLCVNLSAVQLQSRRILNDVVVALAESGIDPKRLELEITETAIVQNFELARNIIFDLKTLGVAIALDDFGMGYSTLGKLSSFKFDTIKIDKYFIQNYSSSIESKAVVDSVMMLARRLNIKTVAEGVETPHQYEYLLAAGCDKVQGYLFGKPAPIQVLVQQLAADRRGGTKIEDALDVITQRHARA